MTGGIIIIVGVGVWGYIVGVVMVGLTVASPRVILLRKLLPLLVNFSFRETSYTGTMHCVVHLMGNQDSYQTG